MHTASLQALTWAFWGSISIWKSSLHSMEHTINIQAISWFTSSLCHWSSGASWSGWNTFHLSQTTWTCRQLYLASFLTLLQGQSSENTNISANVFTKKSLVIIWMFSSLTAGPIWREKDRLSGPHRLAHVPEHYSRISKPKSRRMMRTRLSER